MATKASRASFLYLYFHYGDFHFENVAIINQTGVKNEFTIKEKWVKDLSISD